MIAAYKFHGAPIPKELVPPEIHDIEFTIWTAFWELSTERSSGMVEGHIRWSAIQSYAQTTGIHPLIFKKLIRSMDDAYLAHKNKDD